jgi:tetratricopeptide (TPR) repeat protein
MYCPKCGNRLDETSISCIKCGINLTDLNRVLKVQDPKKEESPSTVPAVAAGKSAKEWKEEGNEYYRKKQFLNAIDCYEKAIAADQSFKEAWFNKAMALKQIGRTDQADVCKGIYDRLKAQDQKNS